MEKLKEQILLKFPAYNKNPEFKVAVTDKLIGRGKYGEVRVGVIKDKKDKKNKRLEIVAIKIVTKYSVSKGRALVQLQNEINLLNVLKSPHIVSMKAYMQEKEDHYLAMEFCNGGDLQTVVDVKGGILSELDARLVLISIAKAVAALHE